MQVYAKKLTKKVLHSSENPKNHWHKKVNIKHPKTATKLSKPIKKSKINTHQRNCKRNKHSKNQLHWYTQKLLLNHQSL